LGLEDYVVVLYSRTSTLSKAAVETRLANLCFVPITNVYYGTSFILRNIDGVVEVLVDGGLKPDEGHLFRRLSVRFAVCQPPTAIAQFLGVVADLQNSFDLARLQNNTIVERSAEAASVAADLTAIERKKQNWISIFRGDDEEIIASSNEAWAHFLAKHPEIRRKGSS
jgi:hypothetical protein